MKGLAAEVTAMAEYDRHDVGRALNDWLKRNSPASEKEAGPRPFLAESCGWEVV
jgi:hypothetical protein